MKLPEGLVMLNSSFGLGRVLLTGHTGFKGSWLSLWLLQLGAEVWGYSLSPEDQRSLSEELALAKDFGNLHSALGDLRDLQALQDIGIKRSLKWCCTWPPSRWFGVAIDPLGTWATNVQGSLHLLEALKLLDHPCAVVMVTTDKVYMNREWDYGYREDDRLGGYDPYSASKAAAELAIASWRSSFCGLGPHQTPYLSIATARAGNVIGGGDWANDRIVPDVMRALDQGNPILVRSPQATRPWHVLEPLVDICY